MDPAILYLILAGAFVALISFIAGLLMGRL